MRNPFRSDEPSAAEKFERFVEFQERAKPWRDAEQEMIRNHAPDCYGIFGSCISCGCNRPMHRACVSHHGNGAHTTDVNERLIAALEAHATPPTR